MQVNQAPSKIEQWLPSRLLKLSAIVQAAGWPTALLATGDTHGLIEGLLLNHAVIAAFGFWPQSTQLGPNVSRLPSDRAGRNEVALTFDDGPDPEITLQVLDLLDCYGAKASFFCIGERVQCYPDLVREIHDRGHRVENHSYHHRWSFAMQGVSKVREEIRGTQDAIADITGRNPLFFRAPFGFRNPWIGPVVQLEGLQLVSWSRRGYDAVIGDTERVTASLTRNLKAGEILLLHDGSSARTRQGGAVVMEVLPKLLDEIGRKGLVACSLGEDMKSRF